MSRQRYPGIYAGIFLFTTVLVFFIWASVSQLDVAVRANGRVIPQARTQVIQAVDGGVLQALYVQEGDTVKKGDVLAQLEPNRAEASFGELDVKIKSLEVAKLRAEAEANMQTPDFSQFGNDVANVVAAQTRLFHQKLASLNEKTDTAAASLEVVRRDYEAFKRLYKFGDKSKKELNQLETQVIKLEGEIEQLKSDYMITARSEVAETESQIASLEFERQNSTLNIEYTKLYSPVDGIVSLLNINTLGGVLRIGDELMQISPTEGGYVIEAKVMPTDIGELTLGLPASVKLGSFDYTIYGSLKGTVSYISPDTLVEKAQDGTSNAYYRALIEVDPSAQTNPRIPAKSAVRPGVTVVADIQTGKRSVINFLVKPISRAFGGALTQR